LLISWAGESHEPTMRKHSSEEIRAMLDAADALAKSGLRQSEICSGLGISVMTLHRWRKQPLAVNTKLASLVPRSGAEPDHADLRRLRELERENQELRNVIAELILEKMRH
jgi:putative transposase